MADDIRSRIAQTIRRVDGTNDRTALVLAVVVGNELVDSGHIDGFDEYVFANVIARINPDKTMGAAALADAIADELNLD